MRKLLEKQVKKSHLIPPIYCVDNCEKCWNIQNNIENCACVSCCHTGAFAFVWEKSNQDWPETIPRCRSPPRFGSPGN